MKTISFSNNWNNKLNNKAFSTLRLHNPTKYIVGQQYEIELQGKNLGTAILKEVRVLRADQLNEFICHLDTGYNKLQTLKILERMYPNLIVNRALFDFCLLVYTNSKQAKPIRQTEQVQLRLPYKD
ncbi:hypothetical protein CYCD_26740 [Tenuifilaceae bacterium CYCD]|nr:hypothetical protein CYCD_26740 [Tenuifilaceae bacterium CYCD]